MRTQNETLLKVDANVDVLAAVRHFVEAKAVAFGVNESDKYDISLVITEVATNVIVHGYKGEPGWMELEVLADGEDLILRLRDDAPQFDPTQVADPDLTLPLERRRLGGMGIHLTRQIMDRLAYRVTPQGFNELTMVKQGVVKGQAEEESDGYYS